MQTGRRIIVERRERCETKVGIPFPEKSGATFLCSPHRTRVVRVVR